MDVSRRKFLGLFGAATAVVVSGIPTSADNIPAIVGDGIHNDGPGLNAFFARKPVRVVDDCVKILDDGSVIFTRGKFLTNNPIDVSQDSRANIDFGHSTIFVGDEFSGDSVIRVSSHQTLYNLRLVANESCHTGKTVYFPANGGPAKSVS